MFPTVKEKNIYFQLHLSHTMSPERVFGRTYKNNACSLVSVLLPDIQGTILPY